MHGHSMGGVHAHVVLAGVGLQVHHLLSVAVAIVLVDEADPFSVEADDAALGEGDAMGVGGEIAQYLLGTAEGALGIDDPLVTRGTGEELFGVLDAGAESGIGAESLAKQIEHAAAEVAGEDAHGRKKFLRRASRESTSRPHLIWFLTHKVVDERRACHEHVLCVVEVEIRLLEKAVPY